jgi:signal transduction histidine kinase
MDLEARARLHEELRRADRRSMFRAAASEIAHELLTPLNVVQARAQLLSLRESDEEIDANVQIILEQIKRVADCLRQMVDAASGEGPHVEFVSLPGICEEAIQLTAPAAQTRKVAIQALPNVASGTARVDRVKTLQLLTNLLANSVDAMPEGGTIDLDAELVHVERTGDPHAAPGNFARFRVCDRGRGFDVSGISMRLSSIRMGTTPKLGLFVCRGVLKEIGGWMTVESEPGSGATISLFVPDGDPA